MVATTLATPTTELLDESRQTLRRLLPVYPTCCDEEDHMREAIFHAVAGLGDCLQYGEARERSQALEALLEVFAWDLAAGGAGVTCAVAEALGRAPLRPSEADRLLAFLTVQSAGYHSEWASGELTELARFA